MEGSTRRLLFDTRNETRLTEARLARRLVISRTRSLALAIAVVDLLAGAVWVTLAPDSATSVAIPGAVLFACVAVSVIVNDRGLEGRAALEMKTEELRESLRRLNAHERPSLTERRRLYREDVAGIAEQYQADSRKYRRVHNSLQSLIMIGSVGTTTIAAFDIGKQLTWQSVSLTAISSAIALAAAFAGYYKYRERSYFLQRTADDIEKEATAVTLGIGPYGDLEHDQEQEALKLLTQRVEDLRNEQRPRQQQLDQPAEQAPPTAPPQSAP
ncbi:DUF4231 domain-containing protein [Streptomyces smyrnaeus]|uniref:DUF4231 domain-containing protein n=1 Tax=Streptomyces smyrnaeus TaxID=1387713 RepID=UPI0037B8B182